VPVSSPDDALPACPSARPHECTETRVGSSAQSFRLPSRVYVPNGGAIRSMSSIHRHIRLSTISLAGCRNTSPSYDLRTSWCSTSDNTNRIDPTRAQRRHHACRRSHNMYYTPDGKYAIVVAAAPPRFPRLADGGWCVRSVPCRGWIMDFRRTAATSAKLRVCQRADQSRRRHATYACRPALRHQACPKM
jgi:hypothetical protein